MRDLNKVVNAFTVYKFIKKLITPFNRMDAYKFKIIDKNGNFLKTQDQLVTPEEKNAGNMFNRLIINLKKIIKKVPDPHMQAQLKTLPTAIFLIKENIDEIGADIENIENAVLDILEKNGIDIRQEMLNEAYNAKNILEPGTYKTISENEIIVENETKAIDCMLGIPIFKINNYVVSSSELVL